mgnify:CR=1 FL=1
MNAIAKRNLGKTVGLIFIGLAIAICGTFSSTAYAKTAAEINATRAAGGRVIAVGTTALRLVESAARGGKVEPWRGETDIFIYPGFQFQAVDGLMTNFHLPKSTLLMLVSALMGKDMIDTIYAHAVAQKYRFFSYGDASLLIPNTPSPISA